MVKCGHVSGNFNSPTWTSQEQPGDRRDENLGNGHDIHGRCDPIPELISRPCFDNRTPVRSPLPEQQPGDETLSTGLRSVDGSTEYLTSWLFATDRTLTPTRSTDQNRNSRTPKQTSAGQLLAQRQTNDDFQSLVLIKTSIVSFRQFCPLASHLGRRIR